MYISIYNIFTRDVTIYKDNFVLELKIVFNLKKELCNDETSEIEVDYIPLQGCKDEVSQSHYFQTCLNFLWNFEVVFEFVDY